MSILDSWKTAPPLVRSSTQATFVAPAQQVGMLLPFRHSLGLKNVMTADEDANSFLLSDDCLQLFDSFVTIWHLKAL